MGKLQSKQECFYVSADLNRALEDSIWTKRSGFNVANYNMDETVSELSICLEERTTTSPLRVDLPPKNLDTETFKLLKLDHVGVGNQGNNENGDRSKLSIEEIECGVQFESSENAKQEWAFTLYDFDGHGRITKEDLASLLKALYDAVGSSIKLPPNGATTLKLRLSVGQENVAQIQSANPKSSQRNKNINKPTKYKVREFSKLNNLTRTQVKCTNENQGQSSMLANHDSPGNLNQSDMRGQSSAQNATNHVTARDHNQLTDLVRENADSNQFMRKHHSEGQQHHKRQQRITGTYCPVTSACTVLSSTVMTATDEAEGASSKKVEDITTAPKESQVRRNYYLDLAGIENTSSKFLNNVTVPTSGAVCARNGSSNRRSRSHDVTTATKCDKMHSSDKCDTTLNSVLEKCDNLQREHGNKLCSGISDTHTQKSKILVTQQMSGQTQSPKATLKEHTEVLNPYNANIRFRPVSLPAQLPLSVLPDHHRRHRHKEKNHDVAMQQVAQWIEREHASALDGDHGLVQRHEHHHIHEHHHHHHFHHHYET
uniref:Protein naked cuticle homolog n=1 Tax=Arion vulgaris TaxID=1028688 RepID=A0A0B7A9M4_9EUPU